MVSVKEIKSSTPISIIFVFIVFNFVGILIVTIVVSTLSVVIGLSSTIVYYDGTKKLSSIRIETTRKMLDSPDRDVRRIISSLI